MNIVFYVLLGLAAGILSGIFGIGGGIVLIPALIYFFGLSQHMAQGTTLALMIPPVGILAALTYYKQGYVNLTIAIFVCIGFLLGGYFGSKIAISISSVHLRKLFAALLFLTSLHMMFTK